MGGVERRSVEVFADDPRSVCRPIEDRPDLILQKRALLLDDDDEIEASGEVADDDRIERPDHADFEEPETRACVAAEAESAERLQQVLPGLAGRNHADLGVVAFGDNAVQAVSALVRQRRWEFVL